MSFWVPRASKMYTTSDLVDIAKFFEHLCFFVGFGGLEADFGSLEKLLAELLAGWMAADPSRPSPLNIILLTPCHSLLSCLLKILVKLLSFFCLTQCSPSCVCCVCVCVSLLLCVCFIVLATCVSFTLRVSTVYDVLFLV